MQVPDPYVLIPVVGEFVKGTSLDRSEREEVVRIALCFSCAQSAAAQGLPHGSVRHRRRRICEQLGVKTTEEVIQALLAFSVSLVAAGTRIQPLTAALPSMWPVRPDAALRRGQDPAPQPFADEVEHRPAKRVGRLAAGRRELRRRVLDAR
jgi:hypothetical protein